MLDESNLKKVFEKDSVNLNGQFDKRHIKLNESSSIMKFQSGKLNSFNFFGNKFWRKVSV